MDARERGAVPVFRVRLAKRWPILTHGAKAHLGQPKLEACHVDCIEGACHGRAMFAQRHVTPCHQRAWPVVCALANGASASRVVVQGQRVPDMRVPGQIPIPGVEGVLRLFAEGKAKRRSQLGKREQLAGVTDGVGDLCHERVRRWEDAAVLAGKELVAELDGCHVHALRREPRQLAAHSPPRLPSPR